jgi:lactoylglutathione lyase
LRNFWFHRQCKISQQKTGWENYFLSSPEGGARIELLSHADMPELLTNRQATGIVALSIALGSETKVNQMTQKVASLGRQILSNHRVTGDGYYESSFLDPEGIMIELTV